jgi:hypothetical protein
MSLSDYKGCGGLTREQFLYHETKTVAKLMTNDILNVIQPQELNSIPIVVLFKDVLAKIK